ncbi:zf-TFIIB domain-containing protein [Brevundimonas terrae]|uniref:Zf-TFIIB domain-containing protein n=1 Tax=Brevundimonas terrae TaxID=363631 RepID=A0ABP3HYS4_9CAUL|nr:zf-TFIIB domain-containing protein [Brevundimonas terrae]NIJ25777.1 hypothetical protein [Brevundimonas terrae]
MPLLMCPNDNAPMQTLDRNGVQFDMCPTCRGVWLDRGELEKLMEGATQDGRASVAAPAPQAPPPQQQHHQPSPWGQQPQQAPYRSREDDYRRHKEDERYYKKKKRLDIFDIFD